MSTQRPVIIVLAASGGGLFAPQQPAASDAAALGATLVKAIASGLPLAVVTTPARAPTVRPHVALRDIVELPQDEARPGIGVGRSIAAGVAARAKASGWLILPAHLWAVCPETLVAVAAALDDHPVAYAQHSGRRGHPVGFGAELYSELVLLGGDDAARRLVARYPSFGVDVDDPGTLVDAATVGDAAMLRSVQGGVAADRLVRVG
jgi:molybdenum cofactor cytidylyltransferase